MNGPDQRSDEVFRYGDLVIDRAAGSIVCSYDVGGHHFEERVAVEGGDWNAPGVEAAAFLVFLLAGVSYYKAFAPPVIDLGDHVVSSGTRAFLRDFYVHGLGEFAYRNDLDLSGLVLVGGREPEPAAAPTIAAPRAVTRPLVPFGGGLDSIVSVEIVRGLTPDAALFVVSRPGDRFEAIEKAATVAGLPVVRASRELDPTILRSRELGFLNGHVPVTGVISAIAVLSAVVTGRDAVVMSNEWSSSVGNLEHHGVVVNHQYSKGEAFESQFRDVVAATVGEAVDYFSLLRPFTEIWIAQRFAEHRQYLHAFRSCNRAFHIDPTQRLDRWCAHCDKCAFVDLVLSPFVPHADLAAVFGGDEPLDNPELLEMFRTLIGTSEGFKPFECVGDVGECRAAVALTSERPDRADSAVLAALRADIAATPFPPVSSDLLSPRGAHHVPEPYASFLRLG